jgi:hypothetical protein
MTFHRTSVVGLYAILRLGRLPVYLVVSQDRTVARLALGGRHAMRAAWAMERERREEPR